MSKDFEAFMSALGEAEIAPVEVPVQASEDVLQSSKVTFTKVRAKNFRSIGNDFIELDLARSPSTLIVSDDNGSGKSTLAIWAPYFALTGKPYAPKEKIGALVNSATRKNCRVELEFNMRGVEWMVIRGYKPSVFEIYRKEAGEWKLEESEAAMRDQQKYLESLVGFDSKILENVVVLGIDKFVPFVEMDAATRRHVVETVWDLGIFPLMLEETKKRCGIKARERSECHIEIDKLEAESKHLDELWKNLATLESHVFNYRGDIDQLTASLEEKNVSLVKLVEEFPGSIEDLREQIFTMKSQLDQVKAEVHARHAEAAEKAQSHYQEILNKREQAEIEVSQKFQPSVDEAKDAALEIERVVKDKQIELDRQIAKERGELVVKVAEAEVEADRISEEFAGAYPKFDGQGFVDRRNALTEKIAGVDSVIADLNSKISDLDLKRDAANMGRVGFTKDISSIESQIRELEPKRQALDAEVASVAHLTECPTCRQFVGEAAVENVKSKLQAQYDELDPTPLQKRIADLQSELEKCNTDLKGYVEAIASLNSELKIQNETRAELVKMSESVVEEGREAFTTYQATKASAVRDKRAEVLASVAGALEKYDADAKSRISELTVWCNSEYARGRDLVYSAVSELKEALIVCKNEFTVSLNDAKNEVENIGTRFAAEFAELTDDLRGEMNAKQAKLDEMNATFENNKASLEATIRDLESKKSQAIERLEAAEKELNDSSNNIGERRGKVALGLTEQNHDLDVINDELTNLAFIQTELGDKAAKAEIIAAYLPFLNKKVNEYLEAMNLFVGFKIDEAFNVEFTAPERNGQTTASLSKGQLARMNLAVLFALRDVANLKASVNTNLLVLDEILEPLSERGVREVTEMIKEKFRGMNVFVISQRAAEFTEHFDHTVSYTLRGGFTHQV